MKELGIARAALVGNSFGAAVALRAAAVAPAAASALVLISPPPLAMDPSAQLSAAWEAEEAALERGDVDAAVDAVVDAWTQPNAPPELRERVAAMQRRIYEVQAGVLEVEEAPDPLEQHPERLKTLDIPTLATAGEHDMPDFRSGAEELAATMPHCEFVLIKGAGHLAPLETPEAFATLALGFLRAHGV
jgi:pimeloyl-ACP methyl ester carboxylesterase